MWFLATVLSVTSTGRSSPFIASLADNTICRWTSERGEVARWKATVTGRYPACSARSVGLDAIATIRKMNTASSGIRNTA